MVEDLPGIDKVSASITHTAQREKNHKRELGIQLSGSILA